MTVSKQLSLSCTVTVAVHFITRLEIWANAQRDGRPAEYRWRPLFNAAVWLCSNAAKTRNPLKFAGVPQTNETISAASRPKFTIVRTCAGDIAAYFCLTSFLPVVDMCLRCEDIARQSCAMVRKRRFFASFLRPAFPASRVQHI